MDLIKLKLWINITFQNCIQFIALKTSRNSLRVFLSIYIMSEKNFEQKMLQNWINTYKNPVFSEKDFC